MCTGSPVRGCLSTWNHVRQHGAGQSTQTVLPAHTARTGTRLCGDFGRPERDLQAGTSVPSATLPFHDVQYDVCSASHRSPACAIGPPGRYSHLSTAGCNNATHCSSRANCTCCRLRPTTQSTHSEFSQLAHRDLFKNFLQPVARGGGSRHPPSRELLFEALVEKCGFRQVHQWEAREERAQHRRVV